MGPGQTTVAPGSSFLCSSTSPKSKTEKITEKNKAYPVHSQSLLAPRVNEDIDRVSRVGVHRTDKPSNPISRRRRRCSTFPFLLLSDFFFFFFPSPSISDSLRSRIKKTYLMILFTIPLANKSENRNTNSDRVSSSENKKWKKKKKKGREINQRISRVGESVGNGVKRPIRNSAMARVAWVRSSHTMQTATLRPCSACIRAAQPHAFGMSKPRPNHGSETLQAGCGGGGAGDRG